MGGEVGRDIRCWRNLMDDVSEAALDKEAARLLAFEREGMPAGKKLLREVFELNLIRMNPVSIPHAALPVSHGF